MTNQQKKECNKIIHISSTAAGGAGLFQKPFGDRKLITPIQVMMTMKLAKVFDVNLTESAAAEELLTCGLVASLGRCASNIVIRRSPISPPIVNMAVAVMMTEVLGWIMMKEFDCGEVVEQLLLVKSAVENDDNQSDSITETYDTVQPKAQCSPREENQPKTNILLCALGSIATLGIACLAIPKFSRKVVNSTYKANIKRQNKKEDGDWGAEIVKKTIDR